MKPRRLVIIGIIATLCAVPAAVALASAQEEHTPGLPEQVRDANRRLRDVDNAIAAGYGSAGSCVSGPEVGAMGIHYGNGELIGDGELHADKPELLVYEQTRRPTPTPRRGIPGIRRGLDCRWQHHAARAGRPALPVRQQPEPVWARSLLRAARVGSGRTTPTGCSSTGTRTCRARSTRANPE